MQIVINYFTFLYIFVTKVKFNIMSKKIRWILCLLLVLPLGVSARIVEKSESVCVNDAIRKDNRPAVDKRLFKSDAVEKQITQMRQLLTNQKLVWMFTNCCPNTLVEDGRPDTFVYTGDIHAMWLRDSGAQVWPYVALANEDAHLKEMVAGVINRQWMCIQIDPYANAFNDGPVGGDWQKDLTKMKPELHVSMKLPLFVTRCVWLISTGR